MLSLAIEVVEAAVFGWLAILDPVSLVVDHKWTALKLAMLEIHITIGDCV